MSAGTVELQIEHRIAICSDVVELVLRSPDGAPLPHWSVGAHIGVRVPDRAERQYSLCGDPGDEAVWRIAVQREPASRGGSAWIHDAGLPGTFLVASGPRNTFPLVPAPSYLFLAGGIGVTPFLAITPAAAATGRPVRTAFGGRRELVASFSERLEVGRLDLYPDEPVPIDHLLDATVPGTAVYCCGPAGMIDAVRAAASGRDVQLHVERFTALPTSAPELDSNKEFALVLARSGRTLAVPAGRSVLDVVTEAGIFVASSCREGTCGSCETMVLEGLPDHRDALTEPGDPDRDESMMLCVSRSLSDRLVIDL